LKFPFPTEVVREGQVKVIVPRLEAFKKERWEYAPSKAPVFYNPLMEMNRDVAVLSLQAYQGFIGRHLKVSEPLAGCGVRGVRFAVEVSGVKEVHINDLNPLAYQMMVKNVELNKVEDRVRVHNLDANLFLSKYAAPNERFDFIDVDPFGSPSPFLDSSVRALKDEGLLALTATDMAPLCGVHPKASIRKYGGKSLRTEYCHEIAVRLVICSLVFAASKHEMGVKPLLAYAMDHYSRVYAVLNHGAKKADESISKVGFILHCFNCFHREVREGIVPPIDLRCDECGSKLEAAGPLWIGNIFDKRFLLSLFEELERRELRNKRRLFRTINLMIDESDGPPTYYRIDKICDKYNWKMPSLSDVIDELKSHGFKATHTHFHNNGLRTDAPASIVLAAVRKRSE